MTDQRLSTKTEDELEKLGEGMNSPPPKKQEPRAQPKPVTEQTGVGRNLQSANTRALAAQLKAKILAAEKAGNVDMATKFRKKLAEVLTAK